SYESFLDRAAEAVPKDEGAAWLRRFPLNEMADYGWVNNPRDRTRAIKSCLAYFGVNAPADWERRYAGFSKDIVFRTSPTFESKVGALSAWLRKGEIEAALVPCATWNAERLKSQIGELRKLTRSKSLAYFIPRLREICATAGVAVVFVRAPSGC